MHQAATSGGVDSLWDIHGSRAFLYPILDNHHISRTSAGLDQGQATKITEGFDGQRRTIGADELGRTVYVPGVLRLR